MTDPQKGTMPPGAQASTEIEPPPAPPPPSVDAAMAPVADRADAMDTLAHVARDALAVLAPKRPPPPRYNCMKCPGYCCSYPIITVTQRDLERLARHFGLAPEIAEKRFTRSGHGYKRIMRRKPDEHFGKICRFFDRVERRCTVYSARPAVCRAFPGEGRCGYYDFLSFERRAQGDPDYVAQTYHA
jgi:Fe-S-cluster containining protein